MTLRFKLQVNKHVNGRESQNLWRYERLKVASTAKNQLDHQVDWFTGMVKAMRWAKWSIKACSCLSVCFAVPNCGGTGFGLFNSSVWSPFHPLSLFGHGSIEFPTNRGCRTAWGKQMPKPRPQFIIMQELWKAFAPCALKQLPICLPISWDSTKLPSPARGRRKLASRSRIYLCGLFSPANSPLDLWAAQFRHRSWFENLRKTSKLQVANPTPGHPGPLLRFRLAEWRKSWLNPPLQS